jgi:hypothetical protein
MINKKKLHKLKLTDLYVCISVEVFNHILENTDKARGTACKTSFHGYRNHNQTISNNLAESIRCPSAFALFWAALRRSRIISKMVTINEPKAIEPRERVDARPNAEMVGCFG